MPLLERDQTRIYYEDHRDEQSSEKSAAPTILLSHGYSATSEMWAGQVEALRSDYRVIIWDLRGHGKSDIPEAVEDYSEQAAVADMAAILDACGVECAVIGGLSLGGYLSLGFHLAHPARVHALMLFDTGPGYKSHKARRGWNDGAEQLAKKIEEVGFDALPKSAEVRATAHQSPVGLSRAARGTLKQFYGRVIESLDRIEVPALVLVGERDRPFLAATDYMAKKIPNASKVVIPDASHAANLSQPSAFNDSVLSFLSGLG